MSVTEYKYVFAILPEDGENFWDFNKELENLTPYAELKNKEGKRRSGRIMTAIWMCFDPKSRAQNSGIREEKQIMLDVATNYLNDKNFPWKDYKNIIDAYKLDCKTNLEIELDEWEMELKKRRIYQKSLPWDTEGETKDKMLATQKKLFDDYLTVKKELDKERAEKSMYGNTTKSFLEKQQK